MKSQHRPRHAKLLGASNGCILFSLALGVLGLPAQAQEFTGSGFASVILGKSLGQCTTTFLDAKYGDGCTRFVADWAHGGIYEDSWSAKPETRLGLQGVAKFSPQLSATGQVTARTAGDQHAALEWLYLTYQVSNEWTVQVGRKRLPLYYYSDFQDVGYAYNTIRPSPDVYGWDVVNYNGVSVSNTTAIGDWSVRSEVLYGSEKTKENASAKFFSPDPKTVEWKDIVNINAEVSKDWFTGRISYTRFNMQQTARNTGVVEITGGPAFELLGMAFNADVGNWIFRSELGTAKMKSKDVDARFSLASLGYRVGSLTWTGGISTYRDDFGRFTTYTGGLRYEVHKGAALKLQFDRIRDASPIGSVLGSSRLISASYDVMF